MIYYFSIFFVSSAVTLLTPPPPPLLPFLLARACDAAFSLLLILILCIFLLLLPLLVSSHTMFPPPNLDSLWAMASETATDSFSLPFPPVLCYTVYPLHPFSIVEPCHRLSFALPLWAFGLWPRHKWLLAT